MKTRPGPIARDLLTQVPVTQPDTKQGVKSLVRLCAESLRRSGRTGLDVFAKSAYEGVVMQNELPDPVKDAVLPPPTVHATEMNALLRPVTLSAYAQPAHQSALNKGSGIATSPQETLDCAASLLAEAKPLRVVARQLQRLCIGALRVNQDRSIVIESLRKHGVQADGSTLTDVAECLVATLEEQNAVSQQQFSDYMGKSVKLRMHADHLTREAQRIGRDLEGEARTTWRKLVAESAQ